MSQRCNPLPTNHAVSLLVAVVVLVANMCLDLDVEAQDAQKPSPKSPGRDISPDPPKQDRPNTDSRPSGQKRPSDQAGPRVPPVQGDRTAPADQAAPRAPASQPAADALTLPNPQDSASTAAVSQETFAPGFFGDFLNTGGNTLVAPGAVLTNPTSDRSWTPLAIGLLASNGQQQYYRSLSNNFGDLLIGIHQFRANSFAYGPNLQLHTQIYQTNAGSTYSSGFSLYDAKKLDGSSTAYASTFSSSATPIAGASGNIVMVSTLAGVAPNHINAYLFGTPSDFARADSTNPAARIPSSNEISSIVYNNVHVGVNTTNGQAALPAAGADINNSLYYVPIYMATHAVPIDIVSPSVGANGVQKLVDNASPLPRDRVFFNYSYFNNVAEALPDGQTINLQRITAGFEKTFFDQRMSLEVRIPFATTIDNVNLTGSTNTNNIQLGNQATYLKALLFHDGQLAISSGLGIQVPTAPSLNMYSTPEPVKAHLPLPESGGPTFDVLQVKNQAVHILPYLGLVYTPNDRFYCQSVVQLDFDANGNAVSTQAVTPEVYDVYGHVGLTGTGLKQTGSLNDTNFVYLSGNAGYWVYKMDDPYEKFFTGFAPTIELHYNQSLQRSDVVAGGYGNVSSSITNISNVNGVIGVNSVIGHDKYLSVGYAMPLTTGVNRFFDGELRVMFNYYFGKPRLNPRFSNVPGL